MVVNSESRRWQVMGRHVDRFGGKAATRVANALQIEYKMASCRKGVVAKGRYLLVCYRQVVG